MKKVADKIARKLIKNGFIAKYVGGCVRDKLLEVEPKDYDIVTNASTDVIQQLFDHTIPIAIGHGIVIVHEDNVNVEVSVMDGSDDQCLLNDSMTRDFTINSLYCDIDNDKVLYDYCEGRKDLKEKILRFNGDPDLRIAEDPCRILRCIRFAVKYDLIIEKNTYNALIENKEKVRLISPERKFKEILGSLRARKPMVYMETLIHTELLPEIFPELIPMIGCSQPEKWHPEGDVFNHTILTLSNLPKNASDELILAALYHDVGKPYANEKYGNSHGHAKESAKIVKCVMERYKASNEMETAVVGMVRNHMIMSDAPRMKSSKLKRLIRLPYFNKLLKLHKADRLSSSKDMESYDFLVEKSRDKIFMSNESLRPMRLLDGSDLIELGYKPGPTFKATLNAVEEQQLEGNLRDIKQARVFASEYMIKLAKETNENIRT